MFELVRSYMIGSGISYQETGTRTDNVCFEKSDKTQHQLLSVDSQLSGQHTQCAGEVGSSTGN